MKIKRFICIIVATLISINANLTVNAGYSGNTLVDSGDNALPIQHKALSMFVDSVASTSPLQAFCEGWNFVFSASGKNPIQLYVQLDQVEKYGGSRSYTFPISDDWEKTSTGIINGLKSIQAVARAQGKETEYLAMVTSGSGYTVEANARIQKYSYSSGGFTALGVYANTATDIDNKFTEFSDAFKNNTKSDYYNWSRTFPPEPIATTYITDPANKDIYRGQSVLFKGFGNNGVDHIDGYINGTKYSTISNPNVDKAQQMKYETNVLMNQLGTYKFKLIGTKAKDNTSLPTQERIVNVIPPVVNITNPTNGSTVVQGTTVTFKGFGTGVHHLNGYVNGNKFSTINNPNSDISVQMKYETTVTLNELKDYTFYIEGSSTADNALPVRSQTYTVHVVAATPNSGTINVVYLDYNTNTKIPESEQSMNGIPFNTPQTINKTDLSGYDFKGSYSTVAANGNTIPDKSKMLSASSQSVTLTATNKIGYVYFWYSKKPVAPVFDCQLSANLYDTTVRAGEYLNVFGMVNDTANHNISQYIWSSYNANEIVPNGNMVKLLYMTQGVYNLNLNVVCEANNVALGTAKITVIEPKPTAIQDLSGKRKENRKITIDASKSSAPNKYPMDWTKTKWRIEPITDTGARWEMGVKLANGTVRTINQSTDQTFLTSQTKFDFQARYAGNYKVTLSVTNSLGLTDTTINIITITPDLSPEANFITDFYVERNQTNPFDATYRKWGITHITDSSFSPDGDPLKQRVWGYRYNSDFDKDATDNPVFTDETTLYKFTGSLTAPFYSAESMRLVVENDNDTNIELWSYEVGWYAYELTVIEDIPDSETIRELLVDSDYRRGNKKEW